MSWILITYLIFLVLTIVILGRNIEDHIGAAVFVTLVSIFWPVFWLFALIITICSVIKYVKK